MKTLSILVGILLCSSSLYSQMSANSTESFSIDGVAGTPGFTESVIDFTTLTDLLNPGRCAAVRFYNVIPEGQSKGTTLSIGTNDNGKELNGILGAKTYMCYSNLSGDRALVDKQSKNVASKGCENMKNAQHESYSVLFQKTNLQQMISSAQSSGANAFRVVPSGMDSDGKNYNTMTLVAVKISDGQIAPVGSSGELELKGTEPCPPFCGPDEYYLNR